MEHGLSDFEIIILLYFKSQKTEKKMIFFLKRLTTLKISRNETLALADQEYLNFY